MKKIITLICIAGILPAFGQSLVFSNQTITVEPSQLSVESVEYSPLKVVTNTVTEWVEVTEVTTNEQHMGLGDYLVETNAVSQQVSSEEVITQSAMWTVNVIFALPKGYAWRLNGFPVCVERFKTRLQVPVDPQLFSSQLAAQGAPVGMAAGLEFAASNGAYQPTGAVKDSFLSFAAAVLAGGVGQ